MQSGCLSTVPERAAVATGATSGSPRRLSVLGATGSIGRNTLDLVSRQPDAFEIVALSAHSNVAELAELAIRHRAARAVIGDASLYGELKGRLAGTAVEAAAGQTALIEAACEPADCVMAAIVGAAGLEPAFAALAHGARLALANKECLVSAGSVFMAEVERQGAELMPVDSEHSACFQLIERAEAGTIEKITLTASGGPFRNWSQEQLAAATREQALKHPNWSMGAKITIDSATMMNKALELVEAYHLFPVEAHQLGSVVHPQSIVHCLVSFTDGSVLAQLSEPDMRTPIALALSWPARMHAPTKRLDLATIATLTFEPPDEVRFPALRLAREVLARGQTAPAVLNAANEVAVEAFLAGRIGFLDIARTAEICLENADRAGVIVEASCLNDILSIDLEARRLAAVVLEQLS